MRASKYLTLTVGTATAAVAGMVIGGVGFAAPARVPDKAGKVSLCFNGKEARNANGGADLRIYDAGQNSKKCASGDTKLTINQRGPAGPQGPSAISVSSFMSSTAGSDVIQAIDGRVSGNLGDNWTTAAFKLSISNYRLNAAVPVAATNIYLIVVDPDGTGPLPFATAGTCTIVAGATASDSDNYCTVAGPIVIPAGAFYGIKNSSTVANNIPGGSSSSHTVKPA